MVGIAEASAAINSIKVAFGIAQGIGALKTEAEINAAVIEIQRTLLQAQSEAFADKETIGGLLARIRELETKATDGGEWEVVKSRYVLTESPLGAFTYDLKVEHYDEEVAHRLCVTCFNGGVKSVLHVKNKGNGGEIVTCGSCQTDLKLAKFNHSPVVVTSRRDWSRF